MRQHQNIAPSTPGNNPAWPKAIQGKRRAKHRLFRHARIQMKKQFPESFPPQGLDMLMNDCRCVFTYPKGFHDNPPGRPIHPNRKGRMRRLDFSLAFDLMNVAR